MFFLKDLEEDFTNSIAHTALFQQEIMLKSLESIAKLKGIPFITVSQNDITPVDWGRDLMHRGPKTMELIASSFHDKYIHESS
jgi:hypothetical protein